MSDQKKKPKAAEKRPRGRPREAVPAATAARICEWLYEGKSLRSFCALKGSPKRQTIDDWRAKDPEFASRFARAREASADVLVELAQEIADDTSNDTEETEHGSRANSEWIARSRLRVDLLLKRAACYQPKVWGAKAQVDHSGGVNVTVATGVPSREEEAGGAE